MSDGVRKRSGEEAASNSYADGAPWQSLDLFAPSEEHVSLHQMLRSFVAREVEPQAAVHDREERFNLALFRRAGELGLLGVTVPERFGGSGLDAVAAVQLYEALSSSDPGFALAVLAVLGAIPFLGGLILLAAVLLGLGGLVRAVAGGRAPLAV